MIPRQIHQIWIQGPEHFQSNRKEEHEWSLRLRNMYPQWTYHLWSLVEIQDLIRRGYPKLVPLLEASPSHAFTSDLGRLAILHSLGGMYIDTDYLVLKPFDHLIQNHVSFACLYYDVFNDFDAHLLKNWRHNNCLMLSAPNSPVSNEWMNNVTQSSPYVSGSKVNYVMSNSLMNYDRAVKKHINDSDVLVLSNCLLEPLHGMNKGKTCSGVLDCRQKFPSAYAVHFGSASWYPYPRLAHFGSRVYSGLRDQWQISFLVLLSTTILFLGTTIALLIIRAR